MSQDRHFPEAGLLRRFEDCAFLKREVGLFALDNNLGPATRRRIIPHGYFHVKKVIQISGTIAPGTRTIILAITTLTATRTMGGIRGPRTLTGIPRPHRIPIRRQTL